MSNTENLYRVISENIRKERKKLHISQAELAERAELSVDTVKGIESGRRAMSLDTYLRIVQALKTDPVTLMLQEEFREKYMERFIFLTAARDEKEVEFVLHIVEQILKEWDNYLAG